MAYSDVALLAVDLDFMARVTAAYSTDTVDVYPHHDPQIWSRDHIWQVASAPGFGDAYASAVAGGVVRPGWDPSVISDTQILSAVQAILAAETPTP